jgi:hypothetical protein
VVFVLNTVDGCIPSDLMLWEEYRGLMATAIRASKIPFLIDAEVSFQTRRFEIEVDHQHAKTRPSETHLQYKARTRSLVADRDPAPWQTRKGSAGSGEFLR